MSDKDIYQILEGLDSAQRSVKQLPALFRPRNTSPQLAGEYPGQNATLGYMVGEDENADNSFNTVRNKKEYLDKRETLLKIITNLGSDSESKAVVKDRVARLDQAARQAGIITETEIHNPMAQAVIRRIANAHPELLMTYGPEAVMQAVDDVTEGEDDWEEIGTSDVSAYVNYVKDHLRDHHGSKEEMGDRKPFAEAQETATEDVLSTMKKKLGDYLQDVASAIKKDPDLVDKIPQDIDQISAIKTIRTDDGHEIKIHGNEDDGFRISIKNKDLKTQFKNLDEAVMACEMYCARRRNAAESADYIEEA
jgi:hypothetical protein